MQVLALPHHTYDHAMSIACKLRKPKQKQKTNRQKNSSIYIYICILMYIFENLYQTVQSGDINCQGQWQIHQKPAIFIARLRINTHQQSHDSFANINPQ